VTFPIGWDTESSYAAFPGNPAQESISPFPLDVVIDRDGTIAYINREYDADGLRAVVEQLLAQ
jgi:peroxiredoxin